MSNLGAGLGPLLGSRFIDFFSVRSLSLDFSWTDPNRSIQIATLNLNIYDFLFVITFILGLITLNILNVLREEGEAGREVVLDALLTPTRELSRPMSSVPGLNFLIQFPFGYLRRMPLPGFDVALDVAAYRIADSARLAKEAVAHGPVASARLIRALGNTISQVWKVGEGMEEYGIEVVRQVGRGIMHAVGQVSLDASQLAHHAVLGTVHALRQTRANPMDVLRGVGRCIV